MTDVNMSIADGSDRSFIDQAVKNLLNRRKQMAPWPFDVHSTEQLFIPMGVWELRDKLRTTQLFDYTDLLNRDVIQRVKVSGIIANRDLDLDLMCTTQFWSTHERKELPVLTSSPHYLRFREWAETATKIQLTNELVYDTVSACVKSMTTYRQFWKALPETMSAIAGYADHLKKNGDPYDSRRAREKLAKAMPELRKSGADAARKLPEEIAAPLRKHKAVIETVMASSMLLSPKTALDNGPFQRTWFRGRITKGSSFDS